MRKWSGPVVVLLVIILLFGCANAGSVNIDLPERPIVDENRYDSYMVFSWRNMEKIVGDFTLKDVEEHAQVIVRGYLLDDAELLAQYAGDLRVVATGCVASTLVVTKCFRGDLSVGDQLRVAEPWFIEDVSGSDIIYYEDNYYPSFPGKDYIFMLIKRTGGIAEGLYSPVHHEYGRYLITEEKVNLKDEKLENSVLGLGEQDAEKYKEFYAKVRRKYMR